MHCKEKTAILSPPVLFNCYVTRTYYIYEHYLQTYRDVKYDDYYPDARG